jgi:hypothetical protein
MCVGPNLLYAKVTEEVPPPPQRAERGAIAEMAAGRD